MFDLTKDYRLLYLPPAPTKRLYFTIYDPTDYHPVILVVCSPEDPPPPADEFRQILRTLLAEGREG